jgi:L-threonylcarbamoyladenylate synthase
MNTMVIKVDATEPDMDRIREAAKYLIQGDLVAFPTETVYGLGANALSEAAVRKIFAAKGRPGDNPLIVHIAHRDDLLPLVASVPPLAEPLMAAFWPGPLTLIFPRSPLVPDVVTAGLDTVAIRMPSHPVAMALIHTAGLPVAAPSANRSGRPSPTCAAHVIDDMDGQIPLIIDGGETGIGLESTVLDLTGEIPTILRPGGVTREELLTVLPQVEMDPAVYGTDMTAPRSPGMKYRHYAPKADMVVVEGDDRLVPARVLQIADDAMRSGKRVGILATVENASFYTGRPVWLIGQRSDAVEIAHRIYTLLRQMDLEDIDLIIAEGIDASGLGAAVMNRLRKAAGFHVILVGRSEE